MRAARTLALASAAWLCAVAAMAEIAPFVGSYAGSAAVDNADGSTEQRDMSVTILQSGEGFLVKWTSVRLRDGAADKSSTYQITFLPTQRDGVYSAAQQRNVFGHSVPLDPMKGEPYVWARIHERTLSVYSLFVTDTGSYEIQQYDRTLVDAGLQLEFARVADGMPLRSVSALLKRQ